MRPVSAASLYASMALRRIRSDWCRSLSLARCAVSWTKGMAAPVSTPMMARVTTNSMSVKPRARIFFIAPLLDGNAQRLRRRVCHRRARRTHRRHLCSDRARRARGQRLEAQQHQAAFAVDGIVGGDDVHLGASALR